MVTEKTREQLNRELTKGDPWSNLEEFVKEHQALLLDGNYATKELEFEDGKLVIDGVRFEISNLGWRSMCGRMARVGNRKPPADYICKLPKNLQNHIMHYHFSEIPDRRHFIRAKASDTGPYIRAWLSESYQRGRFDNIDFVDIILSEFKNKMPGFRPVAYDVGKAIFSVKTLSDAYIVDPVKAELNVGILFSDSEVGAGSVVIRPFVRKPKGGDLFILQDFFRRKHMGAKKYKDKNGKTVVLTTEALKNGVDTDKLSIAVGIKDHISEMVKSYTDDIKETEKAILRFYEAELPIKSWSEEDLSDFFDWLWKRMSTAGLPKKLVKESVTKMAEYDMKNVWGLFNAMTELATDEDTQEGRLDTEVKIAKAVRHLHSLLK